MKRSGSNSSDENIDLLSSNSSIESTSKRNKQRDELHEKANYDRKVWCSHSAEWIADMKKNLKNSK